MQLNTRCDTRANAIEFPYPLLGCWRGMFPTRLSFPDADAFAVQHRPHDCRDNLHFENNNVKNFVKLAIS